MGETPETRVLQNLDKAEQLLTVGKHRVLASLSLLRTAGTQYPHLLLRHSGGRVAEPGALRSSVYSLQAHQRAGRRLGSQAA